MQKTPKFIFPLLLSALLLACEDGEVIEQLVEVPGDTVTVILDPELPYTEIVSYTINEGEYPMLASVREDTIYIYWPVYWDQPDSVTPEIELNEQASVSPASGETIALKSDITYRVTAGDGTTEDYVTRLIINQPDPILLVSLTTINHPGKSKSFAGSYIIPDTTLTHFYFVSENDGTMYEAEILDISEISIKITIPDDIPVGTYTIKLASGVGVFEQEGYEIVEE